MSSYLYGFFASFICSTIIVIIDWVTGKSAITARDFMFIIISSLVSWGFFVGIIIVLCVNNVVIIKKRDVSKM
jgi:hypothetical protein